MFDSLSGLHFLASPRRGVLHAPGHAGQRPSFDQEAQTIRQPSKTPPVLPPLQPPLLCFLSPSFAVSPAQQARGAPWGRRRACVLRWRRRTHGRRAESIRWTNKHVSAWKLSSFCGVGLRGALLCTCGVLGGGHVSIGGCTCPRLLS